MIPLRRHRREGKDVNMTRDELEKIIADDEGETVEVK